MGLPALFSGEDWEDEIAAEAATEFNATIDIQDPKTLVTVPYNTTTGEGGYSVPQVIAADIPARLQQVKSPRTVDTTYDYSEYRPYRVQTRMVDVPGLIPKGFQVVVKTNPRDISIVGKVLAVQVSTNSSNAAVRTIETLMSNGG